jgi:hypothetical protein
MAERNTTLHRREPRREHPRRSSDLLILARIALRYFVQVLLAFVLYSCSYLAGFMLIANLSFYRQDAVLSVFFLIVLVSCVRFIVRGKQDWIAFLAGVALSWIWFPIGFVVLDWAIASGPSPTETSFYTSALRLLFTPEAFLVLLIPVSVVTLATLLGASLGLLVNWVRSRLPTTSTT